jgi:hypothetical protein
MPLLLLEVLLQALQVFLYPLHASLDVRLGGTPCRQLAVPGPSTEDRDTGAHRAELRQVVMADGRQAAQQSYQ